MEGTPIKCMVKKSFPQLQHIFKEGDEVELISVLYDTDVTIHQGYIFCPIIGKRRKFCDPIVKTKGSYKSSIIKTADGNRYPDSCITNAIGYRKWEELFEKITN